MQCKGFARGECKCGAIRLPEPHFMDKLETLRKAVGFPIIISSGYRCAEYNRKVSHTGDTGPHVLGVAADIRVYGSRAFDIVRTAMGVGMTGVGVFQAGPKEKRFIHLDCVPVGTARPNIWSY